MNALIGKGNIVCPLFDPRKIGDLRMRFRREEIPEIEHANSLNVPAGKWPVQGWILLRRSDYNKLSLYRTDFQLKIQDFRINVSHPELTFSNLAIVQARCVTEGIASDPNAIYLVQVTDGRGILWNPWFQFPTASQYNIISPAYPGQYDSLSLNAGAVFTWDAMISDLWTQLATFLGAYPGLPITPTGTPTGWVLAGVSAWPVLCNMLDFIGCRVACDLTKASPYSIVSVGTADATFAANTTTYKGFLQDDLEWIDTGSGRVPGFVVCMFHRRNQYYGTEETVRRDALQWTTTPFYQTAPIAAPAAFTGAVGTHYLWCDFSVRYDIDGNPLAADVTTANTIAAERVQQYYNMIARGTSGYMSRCYAGVLPFTTGSLVDGVRWRMGNDREGRYGWLTDIVRGPQPPWPIIRDDF